MRWQEEQGQEQQPAGYNKGNQRYRMGGSNLIIIIWNIMVVIVDSIIAINRITIYWANERTESTDARVVASSSIFCNACKSKVPGACTYVIVHFLLSPRPNYKTIDESCRTKKDAQKITISMGFGYSQKNCENERNICRCCMSKWCVSFSPYLLL